VACDRTEIWIRHWKGVMENNSKLGVSADEVNFTDDAQAYFRDSMRLPWSQWVCLFFVTILCAFLPLTQQLRNSIT